MAFANLSTMRIIKVIAPVILTLFFVACSSEDELEGERDDAISMKKSASQKNLVLDKRGMDCDHHDVRIPAGYEVAACVDHRGFRYPVDARIKQHHSVSHVTAIRLETGLQYLSKPLSLIYPYVSRTGDRRPEFAWWHKKFFIKEDFMPSPVIALHEALMWTEDWSSYGESHRRFYSSGVPFHHFGWYFDRNSSEDHPTLLLRIFHQHDDSSARFAQSLTYGNLRDSILSSGLEETELGLLEGRQLLELSAKDSSLILLLQEKCPSAYQASLMHELTRARERTNALVVAIHEYELQLDQDRIPWMQDLVIFDLNIQLQQAAVDENRIRNEIEKSCNIEIGYD